MPCYDADGNVIPCPDKEGKNIESVVIPEGVKYTQTGVEPGGEKPSNLPTPEDTYKNVDKDKFPTLDSYKDYVAQYNLDKYGDQTTTKTWIEKNDKKPKTDITNQKTYTPYELKNAPNVPRHLRTQEFDVYTGAKRYGRGGYEDVGTTRESIEHGVEKPGENLENYQTYNVQGITEEDE